MDPNWPKPLSSLPGNEKWTWGSAEGIFAENPDRVFILQRGELPNIRRPKEVDLAELGPSIGFPIGRLPWRDATSASPPGPLDGPNRGKEDVDWRWQHCLVAVNSKGNIVDDKRCDIRQATCFDETATAGVVPGLLLTRTATTTGATRVKTSGASVNGRSKSNGCTASSRDSSASEIRGM